MCSASVLRGRPEQPDPRVDVLLLRPVCCAGAAALPLVEEIHHTGTTGTPRCCCSGFSQSLSSLSPPVCYDCAAVVLNSLRRLPPGSVLPDDDADAVCPGVALQLPQGLGVVSDRVPGDPHHTLHQLLHSGKPKTVDTFCFRLFFYPFLYFLINLSRSLF